MVSLDVRFVVYKLRFLPLRIDNNINIFISILNILFIRPVLVLLVLLRLPHYILGIEHYPSTMHITAARSLTLLGVLAYSSTASAWPQTSISPRNALEYNLAAEPTLSPIPSDTSLPTIAIDQHSNTDTEPEDAHRARNLGPFGQEGFNIATYRTGAPTDAEVVATSPIPTPVPSITAVSKFPHINFPFAVKNTKIF